MKFVFRTKMNPHSSEKNLTKINKTKKNTNLYNRHDKCRIIYKQFYVFFMFLLNTKDFDLSIQIKTIIKNSHMYPKLRK
eukprot:UN26989